MFESGRDAAREVWSTAAGPADDLQRRLDAALESDGWTTIASGDGPTVARGAGPDGTAWQVEVGAEPEGDGSGESRSRVTIAVARQR